METYRVISCPHCFRWQLTTGRKRVKCKYCNRSLNLEKVKVWAETKDHRLARALVQKLSVLETRKPEVINRLIARVISDYEKGILQLNPF